MVVSSPEPDAGDLPVSPDEYAPAGDTDRRPPRHAVHLEYADDVRPYLAPCPQQTIVLSVLETQEQPMGLKRRSWLAAIGVVTLAEAGLIRLGLTFGSTREERRRGLPGDDIVRDPAVQTDHAVTISAAPSAIWPWLVQMGWGRGGWYTARWVDRLLFPANGPSADRIEPELQDVEVGTFIPDGPPETECGLTVVRLEPERALVLRSNSHLPLSWRARAQLDWTWAFVLTPLDGGRATRFHFRSRWVTHPWWLTVGGWLAIVPADFVMARDMLNGVRTRAERDASAVASGAG